MQYESIPIISNIKTYTWENTTNPYNFLFFFFLAYYNLKILAQNLPMGGEGCGAVPISYMAPAPAWYLYQMVAKDMMASCGVK